MYMHRQGHINSTHAPSTLERSHPLSEYLPAAKHSVPWRAAALLPWPCWRIVMRRMWEMSAVQMTLFLQWTPIETQTWKLQRWNSKTWICGYLHPAPTLQMHPLTLSRDWNGGNRGLGITLSPDRNRRRDLLRHRCGLPFRLECGGKGGRWTVWGGTNCFY